ncbi:MAG: uracil-DNA glycosylase [Candidatus Eisenbacteria bacterium]|nr:uracil-DNA glycosylase [Candidatus Eisenbacteria bacterium]
MRDMIELRGVVEACRRCPLGRTRTQPVFGAGDESADVVLIGEAPGRREDESGVPFVGQAGKLLDKALEAVGLRREEIYIANVLKCRPPENRNPKREEIEACRPFLEEQLALIRPRVLVPMGNFALNLFTRKRVSISKAHGQRFSWSDRTVIPIYHPAAVLYNRSLETVLAEDFRRIVAFLASGDEAEAEPEQMTLF